MLTGKRTCNIFPRHDVPVIILVLEAGENKFTLPEIERQGIIPFILGMVVWNLGISHTPAEPEPAIESPVPPPVQQIEAPPGGPPPAGAPAATLVSAGPGGEIYQVRDGSLVGRGAGSDVWLRDRTVSRRHARFRYAQGIWFVQDEGSTGGTLVNSVQVSATRLRPGDRVEFGDAIFTFHSGGNL